MCLFNIKSITLLELLIAIILLSLIVLGFSSIQLFSQYQVFSADSRVKLQNEAVVALEHMSRNIKRAIGNKNDPPIVAYADGKGIRVRIDGQADDPFSGNGQIDAADRWVAYRHEDIGTTDSEIRFYSNATTAALPAGSYVTVSRRIKITTAAMAPEEYGVLFNTSSSDALRVQIRARWLPADPISVDNPEVVMQTRISMPSVSTN